MFVSFSLFPSCSNVFLLFCYLNIHRLSFTSKLRPLSSKTGFLYLIPSPFCSCSRLPIYIFGPHHRLIHRSAWKSHKCCLFSIVLLFLDFCLAWSVWAEETKRANPARRPHHPSVTLSWWNRLRSSYPRGNHELLSILRSIIVELEPTLDRTVMRGVAFHRECARLGRYHVHPLGYYRISPRRCWVNDWGARHNRPCVRQKHHQNQRCRLQLGGWH